MLKRYKETCASYGIISALNSNIKHQTYAEKSTSQNNRPSTLNMSLRTVDTSEGIDTHSEENTLM